MLVLNSEIESEQVALIDRWHIVDFELENSKSNVMLNAMLVF